MYEHLWLIFVAAIPPTIAGFWAVYSSRKNTGKIQDVHLALNSRLDQLIDAVRTLAVADGIAQEKERARLEGINKP